MSQRDPMIWQAWRLINEPPLRPENFQGEDRVAWSFIRQFYCKPFPRRMALAVLLASISGLWVFVYAMTTRYIVDEVVELQWQEQDTRQVADFDPTLPGQRELFLLGEERDRNSINERINERPGRTTDEKLRLLGQVAIILIGNEIFRHGVLWILFAQTVTMGQHLQFHLRQRLHAKLHKLPLSYHDRHSPGRLLTHLFSDVGQMQNIMTDLIRAIPQEVVNILLGLAIIFWLDWELALLVAVALPAYGVSYRWFKKRLKIVNENLREREGWLNGHIANRINSFVVVKGFVREKSEVREFLQRTRPIMRSHLAASVLNTGFAVVCAVITGTATTMILWLGTLRVRDGLLSVGDLMMFLGSAGYLFTPIQQLTNKANRYHRLRVLASRVMRLLDEPVTLLDPPVALPVPSRPCEVRVEDLSFQYELQLRAALTRVSFALPAGKRLCIMGPSGSGKSTLAKLLCRLYDPVEGRILLDGVDLRQFAMADLRRYIGFVSQEPVVFRGTIADNIRYGSQEAPLEAVISAAQFAQIHEFIEQLPEQYWTHTHERGLTLSGGQKQRVNLARALLYNPMLMILDDCTSALDAQTESRLVDSFKTVLRNRTSIMVSHRVSVAMECDYVLMLEDGAVAEFGAPQDLLRRGGAFASLHDKQVNRAALAPPAGLATSVDEMEFMT